MTMIRIGHFMRRELLSLPSHSLRRLPPLLPATALFAFCRDIFLCWTAVTASPSHARSLVLVYVYVCG